MATFWTVVTVIAVLVVLIISHAFAWYRGFESGGYVASLKALNERAAGLLKDREQSK